MIGDLLIVTGMAYGLVCLLVACDWLVGRWIDD